MRRRITALPLLIAFVLLAGCGGGGSDDDGAATGSSTTLADRGDDAAPADDDDDPSPEPESTGSTQPAPAGGDRGTATTRASGEPAAGVGAKPGRYVYIVSGTASGGTPPTTQRHEDRSTLVVDPANGLDQRADQSDPSGQGTEVVARHDGGAVFLVSLVLRGQLAKEFRPETPVLAMKADPKAGDTWSWDMRSTDGTTTMHNDLSVLGREQVRIGGRSIDCVKVRHKITMTTSFNGAPITINIDRTNWDSIELRLSVKTHTVTDVPGFIHDESTATLESVDPA